MSRMTEAQRELLSRAVRDTFSDFSGNGAWILDGVQARVALRLEAQGFGQVSMPCLGSSFGFLKATPAGRRAIETEGHTHD